MVGRSEADLTRVYLGRPSSVEIGLCPALQFRPKSDDISRKCPQCASVNCVAIRYSAKQLIPPGRMRSYELKKKTLVQETL